MIRRPLRNVHLYKRKGQDKIVLTLSSAPGSRLLVPGS